MTDFSKQILEKYQVRKTKKQKTEFINFFTSNFCDAVVENAGFPKSRNIIVGSIEKADIVLTAHYDTCAVFPFPNFLTPKNLIIYLLYNMVIIGLFFGISVIAEILIGFITNSFWIRYFSFFVVYFALLYFLIFGKANKHTANDNTSGVITLCEIMALLNDEQKKKTAFVFFDNEEIGLLGSQVFRKMHKKEIDNKLVVNFDCVSDGDNIMLIFNKNAEKSSYEKFDMAFSEFKDKNIILDKSSTTFYPSDQICFKKSIAVAVFKKNKILGLYLNRIHTNRDVVFDEKNIECISKGIKNFIGSV